MEKRWQTVLSYRQCDVTPMVIFVASKYYFQCANYSPNSTWLVTSCLDTTRHVRRVETSVSGRAVRQARHSQNACAWHVERAELCSDVTWRAKWVLGLSNYNHEDVGMCVSNLHRTTLDGVGMRTKLRTHWWWVQSSNHYASWTTNWNKQMAQEPSASIWNPGNSSDKLRHLGRA